MKRLLLQSVAKDEIAGAFAWYARQRPTLGAMFLEAVIATLDVIVERPESFPIIHRDLRRAPVRGRFPYSLVFRLGGDAVTVVACVHGRRNPRRWQLRETPIPVWQLRELERRLDESDREGPTGITWEQLAQEIQSRFK